MPTMVNDLAVERDHYGVLKSKKPIKHLVQGWHRELGALWVPDLNKLNHTDNGAAKKGRLLGNKRFLDGP